MVFKETTKKYKSTHRLVDEIEKTISVLENKH